MPVNDTDINTRRRHEPRGIAFWAPKGRRFRERSDSHERSELDCTLTVYCCRWSGRCPCCQNLATASVDVTSLGRVIPTDFDGFSIEVDDSANKYLGVASSPNLVFHQLLKNLGKATIRIGGSSEDYSCWNPSQAPQPAGCKFTS